MTEIILTSSVLIGFLIVLRYLLRGRIHPTVQYALWLLVAVRLLIPGTLFTAPVSVMGATDALHSAIEHAFPDEDEQAVHSNPPIYTIPDNIPPEKVENHGDTVITYYPPQATYPTPVKVINWADVIWKTGIALAGAALLLSNLTFYNRLRKKRKLLTPGDLPHTCRVPVYVVEGLPSPCLFGLIRPAIYINQEALAPQRLEHILTHEETHLRHGDHLWALLRSLCLVIHWYNPLVWWAASLSRRDCELSCDAAAIHRLGEAQRIVYGQTLLSMIVPRTSPADLLRTATTMTAGKRTMRERILLIAKRPRMLKITLALVVLTMCAAVVLVFGGAVEEPAKQDDDQTSTNTSTTDDAQDSVNGTTGNAAAVLTEESAVELYHQAREIWNWFELGTLPTTDTALQTEEGTMHQVSGFDTLKGLRSKLEQHFSPELAEHLLTNYTTFQEADGKLFVLPAQRGSNIYAGEETVTAFLLTGAEAAQQGYDCHIYATTGVLDFYVPETVLYQKRHDWYMSWNGQNYVFTSFGPYDDVDPQKYYNALTIVEHHRDGADVITWWPMLACLDWNALRATEEHWPEDTDMCYEVNVGILEYIKAQGKDLTAAEYDHILSATEGLDGAYAEMYQDIVYLLYQRNPALFAYVVLDGLLSLNNQTQIIDYFRLAEQYRRPTPPDGTAMTREETVAMLQKSLSEALSASPSEMTFTQPGQSALFVPMSAYGVYAASYTSSDPGVATVDDLGFVTAVNPGTTTITLHYEGAGGQKDFTCAVSCGWAESEETPDSPQMQDGEIIRGLQRGYAPTVFSTGSLENLELTLTNDWTLAGIEAALLSTVQRYIEGTPLEGDARSVTISYGFQFPENMRDGVVMDVPFFIDYVDTDVYVLPSGDSYSPSSRTNELTATVTLAGSGVTAPVDEAFAEGQVLYQKLAECVRISDIEVSCKLESYDLSAEIMSRINANMAASGATGCFIRGLSFGSYYNPVWCDPGYTQVISVTVDFAYEDGQTSTFPTEVTVETV